MWGFVIWGETLSLLTLLGGALIIGASIALSRDRMPKATIVPFVVKTK